MTIINKIEFLIDHIDPLGQGVFKQDEKIYFIPKTLPGESGIAKVLKKKKGVHFCELETLYQKSPKRIESLCHHFSVCNGCHFLHTDYATELSFKETSFRRMLKVLNYDGKVQTIESSKRLGYRNRIQLHYHKKAQVLGFKDGKTNKIVSVSKCKIAEENITQELQDLYNKDSWQNQVISPSAGHIELYNSPSGLKKTWNERYASGGFTQVNTEMNEKMKKFLNKYLNQVQPGEILDLFGGGGNLSENFPNQRLVIDLYSKEIEANFFSTNLHEEDALNSFNQEYPDKEIETFIIDPPRAGFPLIKEWVKDKMPTNICYISCHPQTMMRDLQKIKELEAYEISDVVLLDLFPSTFHFEALITLKKS
jgi:23S rRNA (uracil1939-C5)-methyltransferase